MSDLIKTYTIKSKLHVNSICNHKIGEKLSITETNFRYTNEYQPVGSKKDLWPPICLKNDREKNKV